MTEEYPVEKYTRAYAITRVIVRLVVPLLGGITVIGAENIPQTGPIILAPNHRSYMDPPYLSLVTKRQLHLMAKDSLFRVPLFGAYIKAMGAFPVKRGAADRGALKRAMAELAAGRVMGIFPEGTRAEPGTLLPGEKGFALVARQTGVPIVPIALERTSKVLPKHGGLHRAHVRAIIGKPVTASEMLAAYPDPSKDALTIISEATMRAIAALMSEPVTILEPEEAKKDGIHRGSAEQESRP